MVHNEDTYRTLALVTALLKDRNAINGGDLATETSLSAVAEAEALLAKRRAAPAVDNRLESEYFRLYAWQEGRVLNAGDIADVQAAADELVERRKAMMLHEAEVGRLRTIVRVNILRLAPGTSHEEIDNLLNQ